MSEDFIIFSQFVDGRLTEEEVTRMEARLMNDAHFRSRYVRFMNLNFTLEEEIADGLIANLPAPTNPVLLKASSSIISPYNRSSYIKSSNSSFGRFFLKFVAVLTIAFASWWFYTSYYSAPKTPVLVERELIPVRALVWSADDAGSEWKPGRVLAEGEYHLPHGSVELRLSYNLKNLDDGDQRHEKSFPTAVRLTVEGPSRFDLRSADYIQLISGKLAAEVLPEAKGFTISANGVEVVDLGTRFAVTADTSGDAAVHVYDGIVEAKVKDLDNQPDTLKTGNTVSLNPNSGQLAAIPFRKQLFAPRPTWSGSLEKATPVVRVLNRPPLSAKRSLKESSEESFIFRERDGVTLNRDVTVNLSEPKRVAARALTKGKFVKTIPAGTKVTTYFANFALEDGKRNGMATFSFDSPILGIIYHHDLILETDHILGAPQTDYNLNEKSDKAGQAALTGLDGNSWVKIHKDRRSVSIGFKRPVGNQVRILVAKD